jgi:hypothetical protein
MSKTDAEIKKEFEETCPEIIHLLFDPEDELDENDEPITFDSFDHEYTYWGQGESNSKTDVNYILKSIHDQQSSSKDERIKELEARLDKAEKVIKRTDTWLKGRGKDFQEDIEYAINAFLTNKTE